MPGALTTLPFAWWNTKVASPSREPSATAAHREAASNVVGRLIERRGCRLVALAEVRRENVLRWVPPGVRASWDAVNDTSGRQHDFDVAIAYDRTAFTLMQHGWARGRYAGQDVRAGLVATFGFADGSDWFIVAAAHWRSNIGGSADADARRTCAAEALRGAIAEGLEAVGDDAPVLILGDFNAEPFASPFDAGLPAARSRAEVRRHRPRAAPQDLLFYNASWRWLGERYPWDGEQATPTLAGTFRWEGSRVPTAWRTFDQVLVSPSLLQSHGWSLDERALGIYDDECVFDRAGARPRAPFDHLPVVGRLRRLAPPASGR